MSADWAHRLADTFKAKFPVRNPAMRKLGREGEHPVVNPDGTAADITPLWSLLQDDGMEVLREGPLVVGLVGDRVTYAAEVGKGTIEIIVGPCDDLHGIRRDYEAGMARLLGAASQLGLLVLGYGIQPCTPASPSLLTAKQRYLVLRDMLGDAWDWFGVTASDQLHVDVVPAEMMAATNLGNLLAPVTIALCGNSPVMAGAPSGSCSTREAMMGTIHAHGHRHGMPEGPSPDLADWIERTLDLAFLMERLPDGTNVPYGPSFRTWLNTHQPDEERAFQAWIWHEHYIWNSARPRCAHGTVELRSPCQQPWSEHMAAAALGTGMVAAHVALAAYVAEALGPDAWARMAAWHDAVMTHGLAVEDPAPGFLAGVMSRVRQGLVDRGLGEEVYLDVLDARLAVRKNPAQVALEVFASGGVPALVAHAQVR